MELLNISPVAILPRTMWLVVRAIAATPGLTRSELRDAVCPPTLLPDTPVQNEGGASHVKVALNAAIRFGLVEASEGADADSQMLSTKEDKDVEAFASRLRRAVLRGVDGMESPPEDLLKGIGWLLSQAPTAPVDQGRAETEAEPQFKNPVRWNTFTYWVTFLGLGRQWPLGDGGLSADPTVAVGDVLINPFGPALEIDRQLELTQVLRHIQTELPVVAAGIPVDEGMLPSALAFALRSLNARGDILLERSADAPSVIGFPAGAGATDEAWYSHVTIRRSA